MALAVVASNEAGYSTGVTSLVVTTPGTPADKDALYAYLEFQNGDPGTVTPPPGGVAYGPFPHPTRAFWMYVWYKLVTGAEGSTQTFSFSSTDGIAVVGLIRDDGGARVVFDALGAGTNGFLAGDDVTTLAHGGVTTTANNALVMASCSEADGLLTTRPSGYTEWHDGGAANFHVGVSKVQASAGASGTITWTASTTDMIAHTLAFAPEAGGAAASLVPAHRSYRNSLLRR